MGRRLSRGKGRSVTNERGEVIRVGSVVTSNIGGYKRGNTKGIVRKLPGPGETHAEVVYSHIGRTRGLAREPDYVRSYPPSRLAAEALHYKGKGFVESENINYLSPIGRAKRVPTIRTERAPGYGGSAEGVFAGTRSARGLKVPKRKKVGGKLIANLGDHDPFSYGGFLVFSDGKRGHDCVQWDTSDEGYKDETVEVYRFDLPKDVFGDKDWASASEVASGIGSGVAQLVSEGKSRDPRVRAGVLQSIGSHYGYANLDSYPSTMSVKEIKSLYGRAVDGLNRRSR